MEKLSLFAAALALASLTACEDRRRDASGETTTTSATEDLDRAGQEIENAAKKAAEESKRAAEKLERVRIDVSVCEGCDGGAPARR